MTDWKDEVEEIVEGVELPSPPDTPTTQTVINITVQDPQTGQPIAALLVTACHPQAAMDVLQRAAYLLRGGDPNAGS